MDLVEAYFKIHKYILDLMFEDPEISSLIEQERFEEANKIIDEKAREKAKELGVDYELIKDFPKE
jgi:hypothetical protein